MRTILIFSCIFISSTLFSQDFDAKNKAIGLSVAIPYANEKLPEGRTYIPYQLLGFYTLHNFAKQKKNNFWLYLEPQWVVAAYKPKDKYDLEFGANLGLKYEFNFGKTTLLTAAIGSGPHIITVETSHQTRGFIFSDNMELGIRQLFKNSPWELHLKWRYRHISNANIKKPNKGIDTYMVMLTIARQLTRNDKQ